MAVGVDLRGTLAAGVGWVARAHDCGPEPSLRTSPSSSSSRPAAFPSDSLGRIKVARHPPDPDDELRRLGLRAARARLNDEVCGARLKRPRGRTLSAYALSLRRCDSRLRAGREWFSIGPRSQVGEVERRVARGQQSLASPDLYARHPSKREASEYCERRLKFAALRGFLALHARSGIMDRKTP